MSHNFHLYSIQFRFSSVTVNCVTVKTYWHTFVREEYVFLQKIPSVKLNQEFGFRSGRIWLKKKWPRAKTWPSTECQIFVLPLRGYSILTLLIIVVWMRRYVISYSNSFKCLSSLKTSSCLRSDAKISFVLNKGSSYSLVYEETYCISHVAYPFINTKRSFQLHPT